MQAQCLGFRLVTESRLAGAVKKEKPVLLILGNPPYSGHSSNKGDCIRGLIDDYKRVDGRPLGEKNPKWLQDDYVKFLRYAQWKIEQAGRGVVGMITNHSYLDNPTFRGMRQSLLRTFDALYILDVHGNALNPASPHYLFVPRDEALEAAYNRFAGVRGVPRAQRRHRDDARWPDHSLVGGRGVEYGDRFLADEAGAGPARV